MNHPYRGDGESTEEAKKVYERLSDDGKTVLRLLLVGRIDREFWLGAMEFLCLDAAITFDQVPDLKAYVWDNVLNVEEHLAEIKGQRRALILWTALECWAVKLRDDEWSQLIKEVNDARSRR